MTQSHIHQSEFATIHKLTGPQVAALRKKHLTPEEWRKDGAAILWTDAAAARVEAIISSQTPQADEPDQEGQPEVQGLDQAPVPLPEVPDGEDAQPDIEPAGGSEESAGAAEAQAQTTLEVRVLKKARNYLYVYASLNGERIAVLCPRKSRKCLLGKTIQVTAETIDGETRYTQAR